MIPEGPPGRVLQALRNHRFELVASWAVAEELADVLRRPRDPRDEIEQRDIEDVFPLLAPALPKADPIPIRDPDDAPIVAAALAGGADVIVRGMPTSSPIPTSAPGSRLAASRLMTTNRAARRSSMPA